MSNGNIHRRWHSVPLAECGRFLSGGTPRKSVGRYWGGSIPWISAKSLKTFELSDSEDKVTEEGAEAGTTLAPEGAVLFVVRGMSLANEFRVGVATRPVTFNQDVRAIVPNANVDSRYLARFLRYATHTVLGKSDNASHGTKRLQTNDLRQLQIPLPPITEQRRIANIIDTADAVRRNRQVAQDALAKMPLSLFYDLIGDPISNHKSWPVDKLGNCAVLDRGRSRHRPRDAAFLYGGPYPLIQTGDIANANGYITKHSQTYSEAGLAQSRLWPAGTLCITIAANIAKTAILTFPACFPDSVVGLVPSERVTIEYVRYWFVAMEKAIDAAATQVAQKNINLEILRTLDIHLPPLELQSHFSFAVKRFKKADSVAAEARDDADYLFQSLVHHAFRGEL